MFTWSTWVDTIRNFGLIDCCYKKELHYICELEKGFYVSCMLRLSESTDIFGVIMKCVQAVAPHFNFAAEGIRRGFIQLRTQDFFWDSPYSESEFGSVYTTL
jgi:hypothetical protein